MHQKILDHVSHIIDLNESEKAEFQSILSPLKLSKKEYLIKRLK